MKTFKKFLMSINENRESNLIVDFILQNNLMQKYGQEYLGYKILSDIYQNFPYILNNLVKDKEYFEDLINYFINDKSGDIKRNIEKFRHHDMTFDDDVKKVFGNEFTNSIMNTLPINDQKIKKEFLMDLLAGVLEIFSIQKQRGF